MDKFKKLDYKFLLTIAIYLATWAYSLGGMSHDINQLREDVTSLRAMFVAHIDTRNK